MIALTVAQAYDYICIPGSTIGEYPHRYSRWEKKWAPELLPKDDLLCMIFCIPLKRALYEGDIQWEVYKELKETPFIEIVFEAPMAVNARDGHGQDPRNVLMIFKNNYEPPTKDKPVPTVPVKRKRLAG